jgi:hypothetical protein
MWEYMFVEEGDPKKLVEKLNELGKGNWEAFAGTTFTGAFGKVHLVVLLKRQK